MNLSRSLVSLSILALSAVPLVAHAEGPQTNGGPVVVEQTQQPPPNYQQPPPGGQPVYGQPGQPGPGQPGYGQPGYGAPPPPMGPVQDRGRFRFAFDIGGMGFWGQGTGGAVDASLHLGWQLDRLMAIYLLGRVFVGGWGSGDSTRADGGILAGLHVGPAMDFTFGDFFQLGFGITFDELAAAGVAVCSTGCASAYGFGGAGVGIDGRIALILGGGDPAIHRSGFQFVLNIHPTLGFGTSASSGSGGTGADTNFIYGVFNVMIGIGYVGF